MAKKRAIPYYAPGKDADLGLDERNGRKRFWLSPEEDAGKDVVSTFRSVISEQEGYQSACERHYRLYRSMSVQGVLPQTIIAPALNRISSMYGIPASLNVVRPLINTVTSMASMNRPRAMWDTNGATRQTREEARLLERAGDTMMFELEGYERSEEMVHSTAMFGTGYVKVFEREGEPCIDPVFSPEIVVDGLEGMYRNPRTMWRVMFVDRDVLGELYPDSKDEIRDMADARDVDFIWWSRGANRTSGMIPVIEATHLRSGKNATDGCVMIAAGDKLLERVRYDEDEHMYKELRWSLVPDMYYGMGLAEELIGVQLEINRLVRQVQNAIRMLGNPMIMTDNNSGVNFSHFKDMPGLRVSYVNQPPSVVVPQTVHAELFRFLDMLYAKAFEIAGMNQLAFSGQVPKRFSSGRAQDVNMDIVNSRYAWFQRNYERTVVKIIRALLKVGKSTNYKLKVYDRTKLSMLSWKDINFEETKAIMRPWPVSLLGSSPKSKMDGVDWLRTNGLVTDREQQLELIDSPDLEKFTRRALAGSRYVEGEIQRMLDGGGFRPPPSEVSLTKSIVLAQEMLLEGYYDQASDSARLNVQKWIRQAMRMEEARKERLMKLEALKAEAAAAAAAPPADNAAALMPGSPPLPGEGAAAPLPPGAVPPPVDPAQVAAAMTGGQ